MLTKRHPLDPGGQESSRLVGIRGDGELALVADLLRPRHVQPLAEVEEHPDVAVGATDEPEAFLDGLDGALLAAFVGYLMRPKARC